MTNSPQGCQATRTNESSQITYGPGDPSLDPFPPGSPQNANPQNKIGQLVRENSQLKEQISDLNDRISILQSKSQSESRLIQQESDENRQKYHLKVNELRIQIGKLEEGQLSLKQANNDLESRAQFLTQQASSFFSFLGSQFGKKISTFDEAQAEFSSKIRESQLSSAGTTSLEKENNNLRLKLQETNESLKIAAEELEKMRKKLKRISESEAVKTDEKALSDFYEEKIDTLTKDHEDEVQSLTKQNEDLKSALAEASKPKPTAMPTAEGTTKLLETQIQMLKNRSENSEKETQNLRKTISEQEGTIASLAKSKDSISETAKKSEAEAISLSQTLSDLQKKLKASKQQNAVDRDELDKRETEILSLKTSLKEVDLSAKSLRSDLEAERKAKSSPQKQQPIQQPSKDLEELIEKQTAEISELSGQRSKLIVELQRSQILSEAIEREWKCATDEIESLKAESESAKEDLQKAEADEEVEWREAVEKALDIVPVEVSDSLDPELPKQELIVKLAELLKDYASNVSEEESSMKNEKEVERLNKQNSILSSNLSSIIKMLSKSDSEEVKEECARIGVYLESNPTPETIPSIIDESDPSKIAEMFLQFVSEEDLKKQPLSSLYSLFCIVLSSVSSLVEDNSRLREQSEFATKQFSLSDEGKAVYSELEDLRSLKVKIEEGKEELLGFASKYIENPSEDFTELVKQLEEAVGSHPLAAEERSRLDEEVTRLRSEIKDKEIHFAEEKELFERERAEFGDSAEQIIDSLRLRVSEKLEEAESKIGTLTLETNSLKSQYEKIKEENVRMTKEFECKLGSKDEKMRAAEAEAKETKEEIQKLKNASISQTEAYESKVNELTRGIEGFKTETEKSKAKAAHLKERKEFYKQRSKEVQNSTAKTLENLQKRSSELSEKYDSAMKKIEDELKSEKQRNQSLETEKQGYGKQREELSLRNAKLQLAQRSLELKVSNLSEELQRERALFNDKQNAISLSMKAQSESKIDTAIKTVEDTVNLMKLALADVFHQNVQKEVSNEAVIDSFATCLENFAKSDEHWIISDAIRLRRILGVDPSVSLVSIFKELENELSKGDLDVQRISKQREEENKRSEALKKENAKYSNMIGEGSEWLRWSRAMYQQISDGSNAPSSPKELRFLLEEAMISSIHQKPLRRKLELLRSEKNILMRTKIPLMNFSDLKGKVKSIRPIMVGIIFANRLKNFVGTVPTRMVPSLLPSGTASGGMKGRRPLVPIE